MKRILPIIILILSLSFYGFTFIGGRPPFGGTDYTQDANCMGAWRMNNNGGNETDISGENETLTQDGGTIPTSATVPSGYSGTSRDFEVDDTEALYANDGGSTDISGVDQSMSICFWTKAENDPGGNSHIIDKWLGTGDQRGYSVRPDHTNSTMMFVLSSDGEDWNVCEGTVDPYGDTNYHHWCAVYNDTDMRLYHNGALDSNGADNPKVYSGGINNSTDDFVVGAENSVGDSAPFDGLIDQVIIFDRALSAVEVSEIYTKGIEGVKGAND